MANRGYEYKLVKSAAPIYAAGVTFIVYAFVFPLYKWYHYIFAAALSAAVAFIFGLIFPPKRVKVTKRRTLPVSGVDEVDKLIRKAESTLKSVERSGARLAAVNQKLASSAARLSSSGRRILAYLAADAQKAKLLRRFFNYYLPTLDKLLKSYVLFESNKASGQSTDEAKLAIEEAVGEMEIVFKKQLDKLLDDTALDVTTDIDVLEAILQSDGIRKLGGGE